MSDVRARTGGRSARVRSQVLAATADILLTDGLDAATIPAIADRSGVHHTSIYRRWRNRAELVKESILETVAIAVPVPNSGDLRADLIALLNDVRRLLVSPLGAVLLEAAKSDDAGLAELQDTYWNERLDHCSIVVQRAIERGELAPLTDHRLVFELLVGPLHARILFSRGDLDALGIDTIVDIVLFGLLTKRRR